MKTFRCMRLAIQTLCCCMPIAISTPATAMTNRVVLFTGFLSGLDSNPGLSILNTNLAAADIPDYEGQVFTWTQQQEAFDWIQASPTPPETLILIGHSFGGNAALQLANNFLLPNNIDVDLTIQIDSVANLGPGNNDVLPANVDVGINYFQNSTGFFEPQGENFVLGAENFNAEILFNDTSITHTSIDNDPRLHSLITQNIFDNLNENSADFNQDGDIDGSDFLIWQRGLGAAASLENGDANNDGNVDGDDLAIFQSQYGQSPLVANALSIPEPNTLTLVLLAILGFPRNCFMIRRS